MHWAFSVPPPPSSMTSPARRVRCAARSHRSVRPCSDPAARRARPRAARVQDRPRCPGTAPASSPSGTRAATWCSPRTVSLGETSRWKRARAEDAFCVRPKKELLAKQTASWERAFRRWCQTAVLHANQEAFAIMHSVLPRYPGASCFLSTSITF